MKCQILFPEKNKKNISKGHLLKILPRVLGVSRLIDQLDMTITVLTGTYRFTDWLDMALTVLTGR